MEKTDYIQLFDKFLLKQASAEEIQVLIQWLKSEGSFQDWAEEEWNMASSEIDVELQRKLLGEIKLKISDTNFSTPINQTKRFTLSRARYRRWFSQIAAVVT